MNSFTKSLVLLLVLFILAGCGQQTRVNASAILNDQFVIEQQLDTIMNQLIELETKDQQTYQIILTQGKKDSSQAESSISNALATVEERRAAIEQGKVVHQSAAEKYISMEHKIEKIKNSSDKEYMQNLLDLYRSRNKVFDVLCNQYMTGLTLDKELYEMLSDETLPLKPIKDQIAKRNLIFDEVSQLMNEFNRLSEQLLSKRS
jgi:Putative cell-wall binding lipoprotein